VRGLWRGHGWAVRVLWQGRVTRFAKGRRRVAGVKNKTEQAFEDTFLRGKQHGFEEITLKLADDCRYTPDYWSLDDDDVLAFDEVKGFWRDDAKVKIKLAAKLFPQFRFRAWRYEKKTWVRERFGPEDA
jgi:hypothetical protein